MTTATELTGRVGLNLDLRVARALDFQCPADGFHIWKSSLATSCVKCDQMLPLYSDSIAAAMSVVERLKDRDVELLYIHDEKRWRVQIEPPEASCDKCKPPRPSIFYSQSLPEAICRAVLLAVDAKESK